MNDLRESLWFLNDFVSKNPKARDLIPSDYLTQVQSIDPKRILRNAIDGEMMINRDLVQQDLGTFSLDGAFRPWLSVFFQRNATMNLIWNSYREFYNSPCVQSNQTDFCSKFEKKEPDLLGKEMEDPVHQLLVLSNGIQIQTVFEG